MFQWKDPIYATESINGVNITTNGQLKMLNGDNTDELSWGDINNANCYNYCTQPFTNVHIQHNLGGLWHLQQSCTHKWWFQPCPCHEYNLTNCDFSN